MWFLAVLSVMSVFAQSHSYPSSDEGSQTKAFQMIEPYINAKVSDSPNFLKITEASYKYQINGWDSYDFEFTSYLRETDCKKTVSDTSKCSYKDSGKRYECTSQVTRNSNKPWTITATCEKPVQEEGTFTELSNAPKSSFGKVNERLHNWTDATKREMKELKEDVGEEIDKRPSVNRELFTTREVKKQVINEGNSVTYKLKINLIDTHCRKNRRAKLLCLGYYTKDDTKECEVVYRPPNGQVTKMFTIKCDSSPLG